MSFAITIVVPVAAFIAALLVGRWWILFLPVVVWLGVFLSIYFEGSAGDFWPLAMLAQMLIGLAAGGLGMVLRWFASRRAR
jgi:hypothetical protein